jgi:hypothetical protein
VPVKFSSTAFFYLLYPNRAYKIALVKSIPYRRPGNSIIALHLCFAEVLAIYKYWRLGSYIMLGMHLVATIKNPRSGFVKTGDYFTKIAEY